MNNKAMTDYKCTTKTIRTAQMCPSRIQRHANKITRPDGEENNMPNTT